MGYNWPEIGFIAKGDKFRIMITGMIGSYDAEVIDFDEHRASQPILQVYGEDDGHPVVMEPPLKPGDYIIQERLK